MTDNDSNYYANAEIEALRRTLDCVRQITLDFEDMAARRRMDNAELAMLSGELRQMGGNGALTVHPALAAAFQDIEQSIARRKALAKELVQAASNFAQQLIKWATALKEQQSRQTLSAPALPITGAADATLKAPPLTKPPPLESPSTPTEPGGAPEPGIPDVPNLGPATVAVAGAAAATAAAGAWALTFSEVMGKREENIIKYGNPYGPPSQYIHGSSTTGGASGDQSDIQKGWILYDGERRGQDGTIYTRDGQIAVDANGNSRLSNEERQAISQYDSSTDVSRNTPGTVTNTGTLVPASGNWLDPKTPTPVPSQVAAQLVGRKFNSFADFRAAFWQAVAANPSLSSSFTAANLAIMQAGRAPFAPITHHINSSSARSRFNLHHIISIDSGGSVYDLGNIQIVSPLVHTQLH